jgi:C-terminal peptidase prc
MNKRILKTIIGVLCCAHMCAAAQDAPVQPPPFYSRIVRAFAGTFPEQHISKHPLDAAISSLAWTNYLTSLDCDHEYFLKSDVEKFRSQEKEIAGKLKDGDLSFAYEAFDTLRQRVRERYGKYKDGKQFLDAVNTADSELVLQRYLSAFAHAYDPYCEYLSKTMVDELTIQERHALDGIGADIAMRNGFIEIESIVPGGPAGCDTRDIRLRPGDRIIAVAQGSGPAENVLHKPAYQVTKLVRGKKGTKVVLTVIGPESGAKSRQVDLVRDRINYERIMVSSETRRAGHGQIGIVRIPIIYAGNRDTHSCADDVVAALNCMRTQNVDGLIMDLRGNGGGEVPEAERVAGLFVAAGPLGQFVTRRGIEIARNPERNMTYSGPLVVLVDQLTASAAEIVAAILQDYGRAVIVGNSGTHGKGIGQITYRLGRDPAFGSIKVSTIAYYRLSGEALESTGVLPDILVPSEQGVNRATRDWCSIMTNLPPVAKLTFTPMADMNSVITQLRRNMEGRGAIKQSPGTNENDRVLTQGIAVLSDLAAIQQRQHIQFHQ